MKFIQGKPKNILYETKRVAGTHLHGIFDNDAFRTAWFKKIQPNYQGYSYSDYREKTLQAFVNHIGTHVDCDAILSALS
jgi:adenosylcobyric acid synthase